MKPAGTNQGSRQLGLAKRFKQGKTYGRGLIIAQPPLLGKRAGTKSRLFSCDPGGALIFQQESAIPD
jgi:hypothetical protein